MAVLEKKRYICPGETHPITRSVHLSRLAAFFPNCRDCPFRSDTGQLPPQTVERLQRTESRVERKSLFTDEGVRGIYLNELTRRKAEEMSAALASLLWEDAPLVGGAAPRRPARRPGPAVVVGHDERPSSPDLVTGVARALRWMGCQVVDVGLSTRPCFWFAVHHLQAAAGIFVTGAGCGPSWNGLDFVGRDAIPLSRGTHAGFGAAAAEAAASQCDPRPVGLTLDRLERRLRAAPGRPTRQAAPQRTFQAAVPYEAGLWKQFHALRPLCVCAASPLWLVRRTLQKLFETLPCRLVWEPVPLRARETADSCDPDVLRMGEAVRRERADLGVLIDDDGQRCAFFDERGALVPSRTVARLIAETVLAEHPGGTIVLESPQDGGWGDGEPAAAVRLPAGSSQAAMSLAMRGHQSEFGGGDSGRYWFRESFPTCDGILTLARLLQALSRSDAPFSEAAGRDEGRSAPPPLCPSDPPGL